MKNIERNYLICSMFLLMWFLSFKLFDYSHPRHGPDLYLFLYFVINCGFIISGIALTLEARKRKPIFWMLLGATLAAGSYPFIL